MGNFLTQLLMNVTLMTASTAWFVAQVLKTITYAWKDRRFDARRMVGAGGMPSSHSSWVVSLAAAVGFHDGWDSPLFAVTVVVAAIVMYDAAGVRRAAGKQAKVINELVREMKVEHTISEERLKELLGHTPLEVFAGALLGIGIAYLFHCYY